jgi:hypothetical protein
MKEDQSFFHLLGFISESKIIIIYLGMVGHAEAEG